VTEWIWFSSSSSYFSVFSTPSCLGDSEHRVYCMAPWYECEHWAKNTALHLQMVRSYMAKTAAYRRVLSLQNDRPSRCIVDRGTPKCSNQCTNLVLSRQEIFSYAPEICGSNMQADFNIHYPTACGTFYQTFHPIEQPYPNSK
jgi:hypothetical protein